MRGVAALGVLAFHAGQTAETNAVWWGAPVARLNVGVTLFFLLSGLVIYRPFVVARLRGTPAPQLRAFVVRRLARIVPAYWWVLTVLVVLGAVGLAQPLWVYYAFGQVYTREDVFTGLQPAWSLDVELTFYALLPLYALGASRLARRTSPGRALRIELAALAVIVAAVLVLRVATQTPGEFPWLHYTLAGTADWFALGMALALVGAHAERGGALGAALASARRRVGRWWAGALALYALACLLIAAESDPRDVTVALSLFEHAVFGVIALLLLLPLATPSDEPLRGPARVLATRPLVWLGTVSYGIYLWHLPIVHRLDVVELGPAPVALGLVIVAGIALTLPFAAASWHFVERPALELARQRLAGERPALRRAWPVLQRLAPERTPS